MSKYILLIGCAAPPVLQLSEVIDLCRGAEWSPSVILTPTANSWFEQSQLDNLGCPVRVEPRTPDKPKASLEKAAAVVVAPATFNTINKWAAGIADTLALSTLAELLCSGIPIIVAPCVKDVLRQHPAFDESVERLTAKGVMFVSLPEYRGQSGLLEFEWNGLLNYKPFAEGGL